MIQASRCPGCGRADIPARDPCIGCGAGTDEVELGPRGRVIGWTRYPGDAPIVLVELEHGARLLARHHTEQADLGIGEEVRLAQDPDASTFTIEPGS